MVYRPPFIKQLDGTSRGGTNCTVASTCMAVVRHHRGVNPPGTAYWYPQPGTARVWTGDSVGGTTMAQNEAWAISRYNADLLITYRLPWTTFVSYIKAGRGAVLQGQYSVFAGTSFDASGSFRGGHALYVNEMRLTPAGGKEFLLYDPLADGRRTGIYQGPRWISESLLRRFAGSLQLSATSGTTVGVGYVYAMFTRDTEASTSPTPTPTPTSTLRLNTKWKAVAYSRTMYAKVSGARVRAEASTASSVVRTLVLNAPFSIRQKTTVGQSVNGNRTWYGDLSGTRWVHSSVVKLTA